MDEIWFTSDLHLGHVRIIELSNRPFADVAEMNEALIDNWNARVNPPDVVYVLGDMVMGPFAETIELVRRLNGHKFLVPGNHDRVHPAYQDSRRTRQVARWRGMYEDVGLTILPAQVDFEMDVDLEVKLCHFPFERDDLGRRDYDAFLPTDDGRWLLHGHVHERYRVTGHQYNVGVDVHAYAPVHMDEIKAHIRALT